MRPAKNSSGTICLSPVRADDFAFDAQMLAEILWTGATIAEVSCPTVYSEDASSINFRRSGASDMASDACGWRWNIA